MPLKHPTTFSFRYCVLPALSFGAITFVTTITIDLAIHRSLPPQSIPHRVYACSIVSLLFLLRAWFLHNKLTRADEFMAHLYHAKWKILSTVENMECITKKCQHNHDRGHNLCEAALRKEIRTIRSIIGHGPNPVLFIPNTTNEVPKCVNLVGRTPRCTHIRDIRRQRQAAAGN
jgi:hypothetical protein